MRNYQLLVLFYKLLIVLIRCIIFDAALFILKIFCDLTQKFRRSILFTWHMIFLLASIQLKILLALKDALAAVNICYMESRSSFKATWIYPEIDWWTVELRVHFMKLAFVHFVSVEELPAVFAFHILKKNPKLHI